VPPQHHAAPNRGLVLSIINEFDLVTRCDTSYIKSIVSLFRTLHKLPPLPASKESKPTRPLEQAPVELFTLEQRAPPFCEDEWALPSPEYHHVGELVLLSKTLAARPVGENTTVPFNPIQLRAVVAPPEDFCRMLFCRIEVHRRKEYQARVEYLVSGRFNE